MQCKVIIYSKDTTGFVEVISDDVWYGSDVENVKFWVDSAIKDLIKTKRYNEVFYEVKDCSN